MLDRTHFTKYLSQNAIKEKQQKKYLVFQVQTDKIC